MDGLLEQITKADSTTSQYAYDLAGRMTDVNYSDSTSIEYGHNEMGTTTTMVDKTGTTTYQYDDMQRLVSTTDSNDKEVSYAYDILGRRTSITLPDGQSTSYEYDVMDRLSKVYDESQTIAEYEYDANSQLISNVRNDIATTYEYNELGQMETLTTSKLQESIMQFEYEYDKIGNIVSEVRIEEDQTNNRAYTYDGANQLTEFTDNDYTEMYSYDNVGNMLAKDINGIATSYSYNAGNQLTEEIANGQTVGYTYNANGDLTEKTTGENYSYDIQGNLTAIVGNGLDKQYTYNGNGNRLSETTDGETIFYVNDLNRRYVQVLQTYDEDDIINTYTYGAQRISSIGQSDETYLYDGRGSVVGSVSSDDSVVTYAYTAYGDLMPSSPVPTVFGFNGEQSDYSIGIQYLRARYYDVTINRFFQEDDYRGNFVEPQTMNRYIYVGNNPVMGIDPSGYGWQPFKKLGNAISNIAQKVVNTVSSVVTNTVDAVKTTVTTVVNNVVTTVSNAYNKVKNIVSNTVNAANNFVKDTINSINNTAAEIYDGAISIGNKIVNGIKKTGENISNIAQGAWDDTKKIVNSVKPIVEDVAKNVINRIVNFASEYGYDALELISKFCEAYSEDIEFASESYYHYLENRYKLLLSSPATPWLLSSRLAQNVIDPFRLSYSEETGMYYFDADAYQRIWGYGDQFDHLSTLLNFDIDDYIIEFEYQNTDWKIEAWMGQYAVSNGAEIGVYKEKYIDLDGYKNDIYKFVDEDNYLEIQYLVTDEDGNVVVKSDNTLGKMGWKCMLNPVTYKDFVEPEDLTMIGRIEVKDDAMKAALQSAQVRTAGNEYMETPDSIFVIIDGIEYYQFEWSGGHN